MFWYNFQDLFLVFVNVVRTARIVEFGKQVLTYKWFHASILYFKHIRVEVFLKRIELWVFEYKYLLCWWCYVNVALSFKLSWMIIFVCWTWISCGMLPYKSCGCHADDWRFTGDQWFTTVGNPTQNQRSCTTKDQEKATWIQAIIDLIIMWKRFFNPFRLISNE